MPFWSLTEVLEKRLKFGATAPQQRIFVAGDAGYGGGAGKGRTRERREGESKSEYSVSGITPTSRGRPSEGDNSP